MKKKDVKNKKGQEEMLGFAFVVILVIIIGLFFLILALRQSFNITERISARASNLLNSISYLTTSCNNKNIQELIILCKQEKDGVGVEECYLNDDTVSVCEFVEEKIREILNTEKNYKFIASSEEEELIKIGGCSGQERVLSAFLSLPKKINVRLMLCY